MLKLPELIPPLLGLGNDWTPFERAVQEMFPLGKSHAYSLPVSVVIPVYNGGTMLKSVVESCLAQDIDDEFEVLLIDSASNDGCLDALPQDARLRYHSVAVATWRRYTT